MPEVPAPNINQQEVDLSQIPPSIIELYLQRAFEGVTEFQIGDMTIDVDQLSKEYQRRLLGSEFNRP